MSGNDDISSDFFIAPEERDPLRAVQKDLQRPLPKRFYKTVSVAPAEQGFAILLDGRPIKTPARNRLVLPTRRAAQLLADEWQAQGETINPHAMPLTRLVNSALDGAARDIDAVAADITKYAGSDLVCYRADGPVSLAAAQDLVWNPVLDFVRDTYDARFILSQGVMFVAQPPEALAAFAKAVAAHRKPADAALRMAALHSITTLTGSALITLALADGALSPDEAWQAAHVDEDHQMRLWGLDQESLERRENRKTDFYAAVHLLTALDDCGEGESQGQNL